MKFVGFITIITAVVIIAGCSLAKSNASKPNNAAQPNNSQVAQTEPPPPSANQSVQTDVVVSPTQDEVHTPEMGSSERQAIMDALRGNEDIRFQVHHLKVHNGWCWVDTTPLDKNGHATAEGGPNLLHFENGKWKVMDLAKVPEDPNDPLGAEDASPTYVRNLMKTFPGVPKDIFPKSSS
jgi:hypothetical protein